MGVYIKGMEMPKYGCDHCFLRTGNYCGRIEKDESVVEYARKNERHPDCPLVHVPEHGRLVVLDRETALAIAAGSRAIQTTKRFNGASYVYDPLGEDGGPYEIPYVKAGYILRNIWDEYPLDGEKAEEGET